MVKKREIPSVREFFRSGPIFPWLLLTAVTVLFMVILYPTLMKAKHAYEAGDIADADIKAPRDFFIEDHESTEAKRRQAVEGVRTVYAHDLSLAIHLNRLAREAFSKCRQVFETDREVLWIDPNAERETDLPTFSEEESLHEQLMKLKVDFVEMIGISISDGAYSILEKEKFSKEIEDLIVRILAEILNNGVVSNKEFLLKETDRGITLRNLGSGTEKRVRNLKQFYGLDQAKTMVRIVGQPLLKDLDYNLRNLIVDLVQQMIQPNITLNRSETKARRKKAGREIKPILYKIKAGEMLLREGERVTKVQRLKLEALQAQSHEEKHVATGIGAALIVFCLLITTYMLHLNLRSDFQRNRNINLLFIASVLIVFFFLARLSIPLGGALTSNAPLSLTPASIYFGIPMASAAMTLCLFMGIDIALAFAIVISAGTAVILKNRFDLFLYFFLNCTMAAFWMQSCRERNVFIKAGLKIGLLNVVLVTAIDVYTADFAGLKIFWDWAFAFFGGIGAGIVTAGIAPLVEMAYGYTTDIKLLELANLDRPILRRLMLEAPGTYHHSVIVGSLVEAAAAEIGANPLLGKVCGYYHDIGKINKPLYFIENQRHGKNKHDKLAPSMSKRILIAHVKDGVEIAVKNRLGQNIVDTIQQSHGTSLITYFYERAKQQMGDDAINPDDFRYPGPKPQTREAGLVMLADIVEAASRTLENPTPARIQGLVQNLINKVFSDGQLDECELTLKDLHNIAKSIIKILTGIHHHRVEYPEKSVSGNGKEKNGRPDRQQAKQHKSITESDSRSGSSRLKRLGLS